MTLSVWVFPGKFANKIKSLNCAIKDIRNQGIQEFSG